MSANSSKRAGVSTRENTPGAADRPREHTHEQIGSQIPSEQSVCPDCRTTDALQADDGETYCQECGLVVATDHLDRSRTWINTPDGSEPERGGTPITQRRHDKGLPTKIGYSKDGYGNLLSRETQRKFSRLRRWDSQAKTPTTRDESLRTGLGEIARLVSTLELSGSIHNRAATLYREAAAEDLLKGRSIEAIASACVFAACRLERLPRQLVEIVAAARVDDSEIKTSYKLLNQTLGLAVPPPLPQDFLPRLASAIDADSRLEHRARQLTTAPGVGVLANGRSPVGVAAACLYFAHRESDNCFQQITQTCLSEKGNISPATIRTVYHELEALAEEGNFPDPDGNLEDFLDE